MKISSQLKLLTDEYEGFYSCGLTMFNNRSMNRFKTVKDTEKETVIVSDPMVGRKEYEMETFIKGYKQFYSQAVVLE